MNFNHSKCLLLALLACLVSTGCTGDDRSAELERLRARSARNDAAKLPDAPSTDSERLAVARQGVLSQEFAAAELSLQPILAQHPRHAEALLLLAECQAGRGDFRTAIETALSTPPEEAPFGSIARGRAGEWMLRTGQVEQAEQTWRSLLQTAAIDPTEVHRNLAELLNQQGRRIEAAVHLRELAKRDQATSEELFWLITLGDPYIDDQTLSADRRSRFGLGIAKAMRIDGRLTEAKELAERQARTFPESLPVLAFLGKLYEELGEDERFLQWQASLPTGIEGEAEYWSAMGAWERRHGRWETAARCFGEALARDPTDRWSQLALAQSLQAAGESAPSTLAFARYEHLQEASEIAEAFSRSDLPTSKLQRMSTLLEQLGRIDESLAWENLAAQQKANEPDATESLASESPARESLARVDYRRYPLPNPIDWSGAPDQAVDDAKRAAIELVDVAASVGLSFTYDNGSQGLEETYLHQMTGGGIGAIDYDLDGWVDLYLTQAGGDAFARNGSQPNELFRNLGGQRFESVSKSAKADDRGYGQGVCVADLNQDGFADLIVANVGPNRVFLNNGDGTFKSQSNALTNEPGFWTTSIACGDLTGDGLPEVIEINYVDDAHALQTPCRPGQSDCQPRAFRPAADRFFQLQTDGTLHSRLSDTLEQRRAYGFAGLITDLDGVPGNDLFIANDSNDNQLWCRGGLASPVADLALEDQAALRGCATGLLGDRQGCMGIAWGDFDGNQLIDLHITNFANQPVDLYLQEPAGLFVNKTTNFGLYKASLPEVGFGTQAVDFDRDGWLDLAVLNGHVMDRSAQGFPFRMRPQLFRGSPSGFDSVAPNKSGDSYWSTPTLGRTLAVLDWNGDHRADLVGNHLDAPVALLENRSEGGNCVRVQLVGQTSEREAIGARVTARFEDQRWTAWVTGGDGFLCTNEPTVEIGVGDVQQLDELIVEWPSGETSSFAKVPVNSGLLAVENQITLFVLGDDQ